VVQWLRARFNECYEKADFAKSKCAEELPFVDKLLHDTAREMVSAAKTSSVSGGVALTTVP
jgi:serine/threonine-protein kinase ULK/ATG1